MRGERLLPYLLIAPSVIFLLFFFAWPMIDAVLLSLRAADGTLTLANYQRMARDLYFQDALRNTFLLTAVIVPLQVVLALMMALLLGALSKGRDLFLYVWTIPLGISDLAAGIVWLAILTERGYMNSLFYALGIIEGPQLWLSYTTPWTLFLGVVIAETWRATALVMIILVAGVQLIPKEYGEAAEVFGATPWRRFWKVTLPLLKPSLQVALILRTILAVEVFAVVVALGGRDLPVLAGEAYFWYSQYQNAAIAAAYAVLILGISVVATLLFIRLIRVRPEVRP